MDPEALPVEPPPLGDPAGVPVGTTVPGLPPEVPPSVPIGTTLPGPAVGVPAGIPMGAPVGITQLPPVDLGRLSADLVGIQQNRVNANERVAQGMETALTRDQARVEEAFRQSGINHADFKPWDANAAREEFRYDPIEAFGSIGSVFAIVASAFTKQPMNNAMTGAAAAMNAVKAGQAQEYDRAYKAWQDNFKVALERQKIQQTHYRDSISLMQTNQAAGEARMRVNAVRFGDQAALAYLDNGMNKELFDLVEKRNGMALKLNEALPKIALENMKMSDLLNRGYNPQQSNTPESQRALQTWQQDWAGRRYDEDQEFARKWWEDNPEGTTTQFSQAFGEFKRNMTRGRIPTGSEAELERRTAEKLQANPGMPRTEAYDQSLREITSARAVRTPGRANQETVDARAEELRQANPALQPYEAQLQARREVAFQVAPSGNRLDDITQSIDRIGHLEFVIGKVEDLLKKHNFITGLGGTVTRPGEIVLNAIGASDETDRKQFERYLAELKEIAPRALTQSNGRPLAAEVGNVNTIIAGMRPGDTGVNTARAYHELRLFLTKMKGDLEARRGSAPPPARTGVAPPASTSGTAAPASTAAPWANDPVAQ